MSHEAFETLLRCLDADREEAGQKYEKIRKALILYYRINLQVDFREDLVDKAINRIARRIEEGAEIFHVKSGEEEKALLEKMDLDAEKSRKKSVIFVKGKEERPFLRAARYIVMECNKEANQRETSLETTSTREPVYTLREKTKQEECLERCRVVVSDDEYEFLLDYESGDTYKKGKEGKQQKEVRQEMAEALGMSMKALKSKAHRIRQRLRSCLEECADE